MKTLLPLLALLALPAVAKDDFPPPEQVFRYIAELERDHLTVYWNVAPGYYLYKAKLGIDSATPGINLGTPIYPPGEVHHDEFLGDQEIYRDDFTVKVPLSGITPTIHALNLKLKLQGCADAGLCYPPTVWTAQVIVPSKNQ